ncbi:glycoside hydrolase family 13 protein [Rhizobium sp. G21]|uniref:glycoside hydrolase family 13 protein n=1 Tax=Rhizobium sp. G21 TaxID=2758439 RepID=UPI001FEEB53A|nr:alpha-glucosidase [Rhizobium sp. G21]
MVAVRDRLSNLSEKLLRHSNGDGIGDIAGITSRLDYLQRLGVGLLWLSPIFKSPMDDNGYDISDYQAIAPEFGSFDDFDELLSEARKRDIGILLDLVVNHTSDEHVWFQEARKSRDNPFRDYYVWRDPTDKGGLPNQLNSDFGGPAWTFESATGQYYFHQFSHRQPDLNWENADMRRDIYGMMNWWLDKGIAGFRMDVIDRIGKQVDEGVTTDGPHLHDYLQEMHRETLAGRDVLTVGEAWSATPGSALLYTGRARNELSMIFQFEHVTQQWDKVYGKWKPKPFDLVGLKSVLGKWQMALSDDGWNSLFWGNHDLPRAVSRYGDAAGFHRESATMLATALHFLKGTPFVYQGEEIGMTNAAFSSIDQYKDIETLNMHRLHVEAGRSSEEFIAGANQNGRDNARTPMQWSAAPNGGFTTGVPWIETNPNFLRINAETEMGDERSIWNHYRRLIELRKRHPIMVHGAFQSYLDQHPKLFVYTRRLGDERIVVMANFSADIVTATLPTELSTQGRTLITNYEPRERLEGNIEMKPYEAFALLEETLVAVADDNKAESALPAELTKALEPQA